MRGNRRSWDLVDGAELTYHCMCESDSSVEPLGWTGRPVDPWSAHVITTNEDLAALSGVSSGANSSSWRLGHSGTKFYKSDTTARCKRSQSRTKGFPTSHSKPNQSLQTTNKTRPEINLKTATNSKNVSKPTRNKPSLYKDMPDIPFIMEDLHSHPRYRGLNDSLAHLEHYLSSYTYPQMEERLAGSLSQEMYPDCVGYLGEDGGWRRGRGREVKVRPSSIVQVLMEDSVSSQSSHHHLATQRRSSHVLAATRSSGGVCTTSHLTSTDSSRATHTSTQCYSNHPHTPNRDMMEMAAYYRNFGHRHQDGNYNSQKPPDNKSGRKTNLLLGKTGRNLTREAKNSPHTISQSVYEMGVRLTPDSFPPLVISSSHSFSSHKPPTDRSARAKKKRYVRKQKAESTESLAAGLVVNSSSLHKGLTDFGKTRQTAAHKVEEGKPVAMSTKTLSPFQAVLPNLLRTTPCQSQTSEKKIQSSRREQEPLPRGRGELATETPRHKRPDNRRLEDLLFLKGMSTGERGETRRKLARTWIK